MKWGMPGMAGSELVFPCPWVVSRYELPWLLSGDMARHHDFHHSANVGAYGIGLVSASVCV